MITAVHTLVYSDDPAATRTFFRDVLRWPFVADEGDGASAGDWLIFRSGRSEVGVHPTTGERGGQAWTTPRHHDLTLMCDDIAATVAELRGRGAVIDGEPQDRGFGLAVMVAVPGADPVMALRAAARRRLRPLTYVGVEGDELEALLDRVPEGWTRVAVAGRAYGLTRATHTGGRSVSLYAEELGGRDVVSANVWRLDGGAVLRPCEMPALKVEAFLRDWRT